MRFSLGKLMALVAISGVNFFLLGKVGSNPLDYGIPQFFGELILLGALPMLDGLALLALVRSPGRRALDDFLIGGCLALLLYLAVAWELAWAIREATLALLNRVVPLGNPGWAMIVGRLGLAVLANVIPQVAVSVVLGLVLRGWRRRANPIPSLARPPG